MVNAGVTWFKPRLILRSFSVKKENMWLYSNLSKFFPHTGRSETGL